ncbi:MAG: hypothetical protein QOK29_1364 [Rhodospirillaceae bacterium]|nr:hypothetical protein [Rhodospirillaceae bacterium]
MNCWWPLLGACLAVFAVIDSEAGPSVSGVYIGASADALVKLQLIEASGGAVSGDLIELTVDGNGRLREDRAAVAGVVEGSILVLVLSPASFSAIPTMLPAILRDDEIALTGAAAGESLEAHVLRRGEPREFATAADRLRDLSRGRLAARAADLQASQERAVGTADECACGGEKAARIKQENRRQIEYARALLDGLNDLLATADPHLKEFPSIAARYVSTTVQARADLERLNGLAAASSMDSSRKGELLDAIARHGLAARQLHAGVEALEREFRASEGALKTELNKTESICRTHEPRTGDVASNGAPWDSLCPGLLETRARYRGVVALFDKELVGLEGVYRSESETQDRIIAAADALK